MSRVRRVDVGGMIYHVLNRANSRSRWFRSPAHYGAFLEIVKESMHGVPMRILAYCRMPNHWHGVARADSDFRPPATPHDDPHPAKPPLAWTARHVLPKTSSASTGLPLP